MARQKNRREQAGPATSASKQKSETSQAIRGQDSQGKVEVYAIIPGVVDYLATWV